MTTRTFQRSAVAIVTCLMLFAPDFTGSVVHQTPIHYGPVNSTQATGAQSVIVNAAPIDDAELRKHVLLTAGPALVAKMLHRVTTSLPIQTTRRYVSVTTDNTDNWSGYAPNLAGASHKVNEAFGYFTVSFLKTNGPDTATWIGVGGLNTDQTHIVQAGADASMFDAWYEYYPAAPKYIYGVDPGDKMYVDVWFNQGTNQWNTFFMDETTNTYSSSVAGFNADQSSADYITEVQLDSPYNVPNINPVTFSSSYWVDNNGSRQTLNSNEAATLDKVYLDEDRSSGKLCPSGLVSSGDGFTISNC